MVKDRVIEIGRSLDVGETAKNALCPKCQGGRTKEKTFSVTRNELGLLYHCYRASCDTAKGFIAGFESIPESKVKKKPFEPMYYKYRTESLTKQHPPRSQLRLSDEEIKEQGIKYAPDRGTIVFPIFDSRGYSIGVVDRSYSGRKPKAIAYYSNEARHIHFPRRIALRGRWCVIVEDITSAIVGSRCVPHVAIMGTDLTSGEARHLRNFFPNVMFALDADAVEKSLSMAKKYRLLFDKSLPMLLRKDIKDMDDIELLSYFNKLAITMSVQGE